VRRRIAWGLVAVAVVLGIFVVAERHEVIRLLLQTGIKIATGYDVRIGDQRLQADRGAFIDVHVSRDGEPVLDAARVDLSYSLRDLLPGSTHRYGLLGVTIARPDITIVRHPDGTYNVILPTGGPPSAVPGRANPIPIRFTARVRGGLAVLIDRTQFEKNHEVIRLNNISADLSLDSGARTHYTVTGNVQDIKNAPLRAVGTIDLHRGYAMHRVQAASVPFSAIGNFVIDSKAARILSGTARNLDARYYALDVMPNVPIDYHIGGTLDLENGRLSIAQLAQPLDRIRGRLQIADDTFFTSGLDATLADIPVHAAGGIFDFAEPQFRLGVEGTGDLSSWRRALAFAKAQAVRGTTNIGLLVEGRLGSPVLAVRADSERSYYRALALDNVHAAIAIAGNTVFYSPLRARYGGVDLSIHGVMGLGSHPATELALYATGSSDRMPYLNELLANEPMVVDAILHGAGGSIGASGDLASAFDMRRASALFRFDPDGTAHIAPFFVAADNGTLAGEYRLDRKSSTSGFWIVAQDLKLHAPSAVAFPGAGLTRLPPIAGTLRYGAVVGGSSGKTIVLAGRGTAAATTISGIRFDNLAATFSGNLADASINQMHADGPWGSFDGVGTFSTRQIVARGSYAGTLEGLRPFLGGIDAHGAVSGPVGISLGPAGVIVQARDVAFRNAQVHGISIERATGTVGVDNGVLRVYAANAQVAGGGLVASGSFDSSAHNRSRGDRLDVVGAGMSAGSLRGLGVPLDAGVVAVDGAIGSDASTLPTFDGGVVVRDGRAQGYDVAGSAQLALHSGALRVDRGVAALGSAYGFVSGTIGALDSRTPIYALQAQVPAADVARALQTLRLPNYEAQGVFNADLAIGGRGSLPSVAGPVGVPGGEVNGLPFIDASARVSADRLGISARYGSARVGTTDLRFAAISRQSETALSLRAPYATLSDFNNYFDTGDTLGGVGSIAFSLVSSERNFASNGNIAVKGFRYRNLPIGDTGADWSSLRNTVTGNLNVGGARGALHASGTIAFAPSGKLLQTAAGSRYDINASLAHVDLDTWLPAFGYPTVPLLGRVDGKAQIRGRYPDLAINGDATLTNGSFARLPIDSLSASLRSSGGRIELRNAELQTPALAATAQGSLTLRKDTPIALTVHASTSDMPKLILQLTKTNIDVKGSFETTAQIGGTLWAPTFAAAFDASDVDAYGVRVASLFGSLRLNGNNIELRNAGATFAQGEATLAGSLPLQLSPFAVGPADRPVSFDLQLQSVNPSILDGILGHKTKLDGDLDGHVGIVGSLQAPRIYGQLHLTNGSYSSDFERAPVVGTVAIMTFSRTSATLDTFSAHLGRGRVDASGKIAFDRGFDDVNYDIHAVAAAAQIDLPAYGRGALDATLDFARTPPGIAKLSGTAALTDAVIPFAVFLGGNGSGSPVAVAGAPLDMGFNLDLKAGRGVRVRGGSLGAGLDIGATGSAHLAGTLSKPTLDGRFDSTNGTLTYFDRAFRVQSGYVVFTPDSGIVPTLHAVGVTHVINPDQNVSRNPFGSVDVTIKVDGSLDSLAFSLTSDPPGYTRDQIIALIAPFGGFFGSMAFDANTGQGVPTGELPGAPIPGTGQALPGVQLSSAGGTLTVGQEAFNILNTQFTTGLLAPLSNALGQGLGLGSLSLTVDYYGDVGVDARREVGHFLNAVYAETFGIPSRQSFGLQYAPSESTAATLTFFSSSGPTRLFQTPYLNQGSLRLTAGEAAQGNRGFAFTLQRLF
jgi:autotransporter translocation and assembly factor TamB